MVDDLTTSSQEIVQKAFDGCPDVVAITSVATGRFVAANQRLVSLTGHRLEEAIGKTSEELGMWPVAEDRERMVALLRRDGFIRNEEITIAHRSGQPIDCLLFADLIEVGGEPHALVFLHDLTERKRGERERADLLAQLHQAQKIESLGQLAGGVAHDMNNMLTAVMGVISLMQHDPEDAGLRRQRLDDLLQACTRGQDVIRNLLGFARTLEHAPQHVDLDGLIADTVRLVASTIPKGIDVSRRVAPDLHPVIADVGQLSHVLLNLCLNAADAIGSRGRVTIAAKNVTLTAPKQAAQGSLPPGTYVHVAVTDTGSGMDAETRARAFEPFFTTKPPDKGTGLGLSMVHGTITRHGGTVEIDSEPGQGTTISILLPALATPVATLESPPPP